MILLKLYSEDIHIHIHLQSANQFHLLRLIIKQQKNFF
ncbi:hypothetical protein ETAE_3412 [Edwardsiella piscicida]|uniref:Uncharacterized protein n=1 Tax=Edwardsiella piscicida TaxID=1263550 RepID=A0AAU8P6Z4_EDWPI|nr:hypothetical protein ETAE_3412 [Edwardsiella tarda EIB202]